MKKKHKKTAPSRPRIDTRLSERLVCTVSVGGEDEGEGEAFSVTYAVPRDAAGIGVLAGLVSGLGLTLSTAGEAHKLLSAVE